MFMSLRLTLLVALCVVQAPLLAQGSHSARSTSKPKAEAPKSTDDGPTMLETKQWLESAMPDLARQLAYEVHDQELTYPAKVIHWRYRQLSAVTTPTLDDCTLTFFSTLESQGYADGLERGAPFTGTQQKRIRLAGLEPAGITLLESHAGYPGAKYETPVFEVRLEAAPSATDVFTTDAGTHPPRMTIPVRDRESGERIARALARAATLCGAKRSPF
jgi:hypothetical protein